MVLPLVAGGIGLLGGSLLASNLFGDDEAEEEQTESSRLQRDIALQLFQGGTAPTLLRFFGAPPSGAGGLFPEFLETGELPTALQPDISFAPVREAIEAQFANARENIIGRTPARGGQLNALLAANENARAQAVGALELDEALLDVNLRQNLFNTGLNVAFGFPSTTVGGLSSSAASFSAAASRAAALEAQREQEALGLLGFATALALPAAGGGGAALGAFGSQPFVGGTGGFP